MAESKGAGTSYRFCGVREAHSRHVFWIDNGIYPGGRYHNCMGWLIWQQ